MDTETQRINAASTLGISPDAAPDAVMPAYMERMRQFMDFDDGQDTALFSKKARDLYDARVIMSYPQSHALIANLKLALTSRTHKTYQNLIAITGVMYAQSDNWAYRMMLLIIAAELKKIAKYNKTIIALMSYNVAAMMGAFVYNLASDTHGGIVPQAIYGSVIIVAIATMILQNKMDKHQKGLKELMNFVWPQHKR